MSLDATIKLIPFSLTHTSNAATTCFTYLVSLLKSTFNRVVLPSAPLSTACEKDFTTINLDAPTFQRLLNNMVVRAII